MTFDPTQSPIIGAQAAVKESNIAKAQTDAQVAAKQEYAMAPVYFQQDVSSNAVGVTWSLSGSQTWREKLPMILLFVLIGYIVFKD